MNKKGFTLIELLAVIIILAVIALIATPVVLNVVDNARRSAFQRSADGYYDAARYLYDELYLNNDRQDLMFTFEDGVQTSSNENYKLQVKGEEPQGGIVYLASDGQIMISIHNEKYCATTDATGKVNLSEDIENCVQSIPNIPESCYSIQKGPLSNSYDELDGSEDWMNAEYNMLYYGGEGCPTEIDVLILPNEIDGEIVEGISSTSFNQIYIKNLIIPNSIKVIDSDSLYGCRLNNIVLPNSIIYIGALAFTDNQLSDSQAFIYKRNSDGTEDKTTVIGYGGAKRDNVIIPNNVSTIAFGAFAFNQLTSVTIPDSVRTIGDDAFEDNQITSLIIPNGVTTIGAFAFIDNQLTSVTIPNSVTIIGIAAFGNNQLTSVTIPSSVTTIGEDAFSRNRFLNADSITIQGDETRFNSNWATIGFPAK